MRRDRVEERLAELRKNFQQGVVDDGLTEGAGRHGPADKRRRAIGRDAKTGRFIPAQGPERARASEATPTHTA